MTYDPFDYILTTTYDHLPPFAERLFFLAEKGLYYSIIMV